MLAAVVCRPSDAEAVLAAVVCRPSDAKAVLATVICGPSDAEAVLAAVICRPSDEDALSDDDARWEVFGLNIPANPRPPESAEELVLSSAGLGRIIAEWPPGTRSDDDRILIMIVGVDADYREYGKSGGDGEELLKKPP